MKEFLTLTVLRRACGVSQQALSAHLDLFQSDISKWENGETIPERYRKQILQCLRKANKKAVKGVKPSDLDRPYDQVLLDSVRFQKLA